jgi:glycosyltransferase involved in cell wall biosynthesis
MSSGQQSTTSEAKPRSLHVVTSSQRRGAELFALELCAALNRRGLQADIVALAAGAGDPEKALPIPELGTTTRSVRTYRALRTLGRHYDLVVAHGSSTLEATTLALAGSQVPIIYKSIGDSSFWVRTTRQRLLTQALLRRTSGVVALWPEAATYMHDTYGIEDANLHVVPNGIETQRYTLTSAGQRRRVRREFGIETSASTFAYVGALSEEKNAGAAIRAVGAIPHAQLLVAGGGPDRHDLEEAARRIAPGRVRFLGTVEDVCSVLRAADVLLLPSRSEGMPSVILQAGLVGTPTVASRVGAIPQMIEHGVTGYLVPPSDEGLFLSFAAKSVVSAAETGRAAAADFRARFDLARSVDAWLRVMYATTIRAQSSSRGHTHG